MPQTAIPLENQQPKDDGVLVHSEWLLEGRVRRLHARLRRSRTCWMRRPFH